MVHAIPGIAWLVNSIITNTILHRSIIKVVCVITIVYGSINFVATKIKGVPIYDFLHWESMETPLVLCGILGSFSLIYFGLCFIDEKLKWQLVKTRNEKIQQQASDNDSNKNK